MVILIISQCSQFVMDGLDFPIHIVEHFLTVNLVQVFIEVPGFLLHVYDLKGIPLFTHSVVHIIGPISNSALVRSASLSVQL